jgi:hypothetical protein
MLFHDPFITKLLGSPSDQAQDGWSDSDCLKRGVVRGKRCRLGKRKRRRERYTVRDDDGPSVHNGLRKTRPNTGRRASIFKHLKVPFRTFDFHPEGGYNGTTTTKEVPNMTKVKRLTLDRYEHGLLVRALYEEWHRLMAEGRPTEDIENLILKVIDAPARKQLWRA